MKANRLNDHISEPARKTKVIRDVDVAVVGGGTAGFSAALAAVREGAKVAVIERYGTLGGASTLGPIPTWENHYINREGQRIIGGIAFELLEDLVSGAYTPYRDIKEALNCIPFIFHDTEALAYLLFRKASQEKVDLLLHTYFCDSLVEKGAVKGVIVQNKSGRQAILAKQVVDCSGEADVAASAGAEVSHVRGTMGLLAWLAGLDFKKYFDYWESNPDKPSPDYDQWLSKETGMAHDELTQSRWKFWLAAQSAWTTMYGEGTEGSPYQTAENIKQMREAFFKKKGMSPITFPPSILRHRLRETTESGEFYQKRDLEEGGWLMFDPGNNSQIAWVDQGLMSLNMCRVLNVDGSDGDTVSRAEASARQYLFEEIQFLNRYVPGFEKARLERVGVAAMPRWCRQVVGEYSLTEHDVRGGKRFKDVVTLLGGYGVTGECDLPYRMFLPRGIRNLLAAGKGVKGAEFARGVVICLAAGEAVGTAAAMAADQGIQPSDIDVAKLQQGLLNKDFILQPQKM